MEKGKYKINPKVTVLTIARNRAYLLGTAIQSVLNQTYSNFEYIVIDDASQDNSRKVIQDFVDIDSRIRFFQNEIQLGQPNGINRYIPNITGDYVVMLDSDDICLPTRISEQVAFLEQHPTFGAIGCQQQLIDIQGNNARIAKYPIDPIVARWNLLFSCSIMNSSLTVRTPILKQLGGYLDTYRYICDYELVTRIAEVSKIGNIPDVLVKYRRHQNQMTRTNFKEQIIQMLLLQSNIQQRWLGLIPKLYIQHEIQTVVRKVRAIDRQLRQECLDWLDRLTNTFIEQFKLEGTEKDKILQDSNEKRSRLMEGHNEKLFKFQIT